MFTRKWRREWERNRADCFVAAMVVADTCAMGRLPSEAIIDEYRKAEHRFINGPQPKGRKGHR